MAEERNENKNLTHETLWNDYQNGQAYLANMGFTQNIPIYVDFFEGRQYPAATEDTKHIPKPVFNMIEMIVDNKISNVLASPIKHRFIVEGNKLATEKLTRFAEYQKKEMGLAEADDEAAEEGSVKGTYIYHFYWDEKAPGKRGNYEGGLRVQVIDMMNVAFADPSERDEQKQEWIILSQRLPVKKVREMADDDVDKNLITSDMKETLYHYDIEQEGMQECTVLLRYFRKDGEVYFERGTKSTIINKPRPLNPYINLKKLENIAKKDYDPEIAASPDEVLEKKENDIDKPKLSLYPIAVGSWKKRHGSIYGRGEVEALIPNQKAVNQEFSMQLLDHQETGYSKILVKANALNGQEITNVPGEVITDYTPSPNWGIKTLERTSISGSALQLAPQIVDLTRTVTNSNEVITGDMISKDLSGLAIAQLQAQSQKPISRLQKNFWKTQEKIGKILVQFYKFFYRDKEFSYDLTLEELNALRNNPMYQGQLIEQTQFDIFNGEEFMDMNVEVVVEVGAGTQYSEIQSMSMLNSLLAAGLIDPMTYYKLYPENAMPFKADLIAMEEAKQRSELQQLRVLVQQMAQELEKQNTLSKEQDKIIKQLTGELQKSNRMFNALQKEYSDKITVQNEFVMDLMRRQQQGGKRE